MKKLIAIIVLGTFVFSSTLVSTVFAAEVGTAARPYEIQKDEPRAPAPAPPPEPAATTAETAATSEATKAYLSGTRVKWIEGAIFIGALVIMSVAVASDSGSSAPPPPASHH